MDNSLCYKICTLLGVNPYRPTNKPLVISINLVTICCTLLVFLNYYLENVQESLESCNGLVLMAIGYLTLVFKKQVIKQLLDSMEHFWDFNVEDIQVARYVQYFKTVEKIYKGVLIFGMVTHLIRPFLSVNTSIFSCYVPPHIPFYLFYGGEVCYLVFVTSAYVCPNILICFLIISVVIQFRMVNLKIKDLGLVEVENDRDLRKYKEQLKFVVQHQQFLMRCVEDLNNLLSVSLALKMGTTVTFLCISLYFTAIDEISVSNQSRLLVSNFALIAEYFLVYGLPAQLMMNEEEDTADVTYYQCKWYLPGLRPLRNDFLFMIYRSQKNVCIRAGNYHVVNNRTVLLLLKTAYSLFTFLQEVA